MVKKSFYGISIVGYFFKFWSEYEASKNHHWCRNFFLPKKSFVFARSNKVYIFNFRLFLPLPQKTHQAIPLNVFVFIKMAYLPANCHQIFVSFFSKTTFFKKTFFHRPNAFGNFAQLLKIEFIDFNLFTVMLKHR